MEQELEERYRERQYEERAYAERLREAEIERQLKIERFCHQYYFFTGSATVS